MLLTQTAWQRHDPRHRYGSAISWNTSLQAKCLTGLAAIGAALVSVGLVYRLGSSALMLLAVCVIAGTLLSRPGWAIGVLVGAVIFFEADPSSPISFGSRLYDFVPGPKITGVDALLLLATAAVALEVLRRGRAHPLGPAAIGVSVLACAVAMGAVTGNSAGSTIVGLQEGIRPLLPVLVLPLLVVQIVDTVAKLRLALGLLTALVLVKSLLGLLFYVTGANTQSTVSFTATYLESATNVLTMLFLLGGVAALVSRVPLPLWVRVTLPLASASLLLSFRRSFWIATLTGAVLVVVVGSGRTGRRLLAPMLLVLVVAGYFVSTTTSTEVNGPVGERIQQLSPTRIKANKEDRYRLDEQRNVWADIKAHPIAGLGLAQDWHQRYPLSEEHPGGRQYVHFAVLWWWVKLGILGPIGYLTLLLTTVVVGVNTWRRSADPVIGVAALGSAMGLLGLCVAELTATFTGAEVRTSVVVGCVVGLVGSARRIA